ncbi:alcohol dehydrogenase catalytic domain-containing protein [Micromonospora sp. KLBMP9576]|uniref:alcohol dehydrogenase catalytic domain-containing protein n=1 Tax=Micromonospora sp. KLBMP9576 TaxID=3424769 RepID=UPI003D920C8E
MMQVKAAGLCHSDLMYMEIGAAAMPFLPMTQGHENAGVISALGAQVEGWQIGDVVGVCSSGVREEQGHGAARRPLRRLNVVSRVGAPG